MSSIQYWIFSELQINGMLLPFSLDYVKSGVFGVTFNLVSVRETDQKHRSSGNDNATII